MIRKSGDLPICILNILRGKGCLKSRYQLNVYVSLCIWLEYTYLPLQRFPRGGSVFYFL